MTFVILPVDVVTSVEINEPHVLISITDPRSSQIRFNDNRFRLETLHLSFSDVKENLHKGHPKMSMEQGCQVVDLVERHTCTNPTYVIHCTAGLSRSPAVAAAIAAINGENVLVFWEKFLPNGHVFSNILTCYAMKKWHQDSKDPLFT